MRYIALIENREVEFADENAVAEVRRRGAERLSILADPNTAGRLALMSVVNGQSNSHPLRDDRWLLAGVGSGVLLHRAGDGALRRRLIKLLSADWVPPSVSSSRGWSFV